LVTDGQEVAQAEIIAAASSATSETFNRTSKKVLCNLGNADACASVAPLMYKGDEGPIDLVGARKAFSVACLKNRDASACNMQGLMEELGQGGPVDLSGARLRYREACAGRSAEGCGNFASMAYSGRGGEADRAEARAAYRASCDLKPSASACYGAAYMEAKGEGGPADYGAARRDYEGACVAGSVWGCNALGIYRRSGLGGPSDPAGARQAFEKACNGGVALACWELAILWETAKGGEADKAYARSLYDRSCSMGAAEACRESGRVRYYGIGGAKDASGALTYYKKGCDGGHVQSCTDLKAAQSSAAPAGSSSSSWPALLYGTWTGTACGAPATMIIYKGVLSEGRRYVIGKDIFGNNVYTTDTYTRDVIVVRSKSTYANRSRYRETWVPMNVARDKFRPGGWTLDFDAQKGTLSGWFATTQVGYLGYQACTDVVLRQSSTSLDAELVKMPQYGNIHWTDSWY
jgi:TPR repeat protein